MKSRVDLHDRKLAPPIKSQFKKKLAERLLNPHVPASKLRVIDDEIVVYVLAVGKCDKDAIYKNLSKRI
ncbi:type II toxin-antitoxin system RelE family toxin [Oceanospirillum linum]|uniref:type II toxin-antitoxin system RelE family toxin n=1 Tax=Oceanospirillum linum TaxID=966 RepID=UPI001EE3AA4E|nr:hypothetical protein [Oceanospirillum linum]